eukprot:NODE_59_length_28102_cov_0.971110.p1 type:complete len:769 gc:universal NODE_59_length_28102_cov_0.971110:3980-6286(+)
MTICLRLSFYSNLFEKEMSEASQNNYDHKMAALLPPARVLGTYYQGGSVFPMNQKFKEKDGTLLDSKSGGLLEMDKNGLVVLEPGADYVINKIESGTRRKSKAYDTIQGNKNQRKVSAQSNTFATVRKPFNSSKSSTMAPQSTESAAPISSERRRSILPEFTSIFTSQQEATIIPEPESPIDGEEVINRLKVPPLKGFLEVQIFKENSFVRRLVELVSFNLIVTTGQNEIDRLVFTLNKSSMALVSENHSDDYNFDLFVGQDMITFKCISKAQMMAWVSSINTSCTNLYLLEIMHSFDMKEFRITLEKSFKFYFQKFNTNIAEELENIIKELQKYSQQKKVAWTKTSTEGNSPDTQTAVNFFTVLTARKSIRRDHTNKKRIPKLPSKISKSIEFQEQDEDLFNKLQDLIMSDDQIEQKKESALSNLKIESDSPASDFSITSLNEDPESFLDELYKIVEQADYLPESKKTELKKQAREMNNFLIQNNSEILRGSQTLTNDSNNELNNTVKINEEISKIPDLRAPIKQDDSNYGMLRQDSWDELGNPQVYYSTNSEKQTSKFDIAAASIDKLVERLADHFGPADDGYIKTLFLGYRHVLDNQTFFKKIISRLNSEVENTEKFSRLHLHTRIIKAVSFWIENYWVDFQSPEMQLVLQGFLAVIEDNILVTNHQKLKILSEYLGSLIQTKIEETSQKSIKPKGNKKNPKMVIDNFLLAYNAQTISRTITELEFDRFLKLESIETLLQLWSPVESVQDYPNLGNLINSFNNVI